MLIDDATVMQSYSFQLRVDNPLNNAVVVSLFVFTHPLVFGNKT